MKFFDYQPAPSPRRVRVFMSEKGIELPAVQIDLANGGQYDEAFRAVNPRCTVPVLQLDDGTCLTETLAICSYLEACYPGPPLLGRDARERALILQWNSRVEVEGLLAIAESFRNHSRGFRDRALTGPEPYAQLPELVERGRQRAERFFDMLDAHLAQSPYVVGSHFSMADITAMISVDFAGWIKLGIGERSHLARWYRSVAARPSAAA
jgi:glutathione S-transferase